MKTRLLIILSFGILSLNAQTTYDLDWYMGIGTNVDLTINTGDTVRWTWGDAFPHTVQNNVGSAETFDSTFLTGIGEQYSYTFTVEGVNPYYCGVHGALSMSGTITVNPALGVDDKTVSGFKMYPNPSNSTLYLKLPQQITKGNITVFDVLGKELYRQTFDETNVIELNITNWINGLYLIKVKSESVSQTQQFIKN